MTALSPIVTRVGHARFDDHHFCGYGQLNELLGQESYMGLLALAAGGRRMTSEETAVLDDFAVALSAADPRIWPLKVTRLVASYGGMLAGFAAGQLCTAGSTIGGTVVGAAAELLIRIRAATAALTDAPAVRAVIRAIIAEADRLPGYGVAFRAQDERLVALRPRLAARGRTEMEHWKLFERVSEVVAEDRKLQPNITVAAAAFLLDMGFLPDQAAVVGTFAIQSAFIANAVEGAAKPQPCLRALPTDSIDYVGRAPRQSPAATANRARMTSDWDRDVELSATA